MIKLYLHLRLHYLINAKKGRIVSSTVKEMKRMKAASNAQIESWVPVMDSAFIDSQRAAMQTSFTPQMGG